ncbi:GNAT family N-acetyltransferase [Streptodolium elevatio]|uniref:GNAT family N-acetyltransferase n=1 Tax=Streptodolium elevatio TaxID=3157996 RepID=A0ABV3DPQ4_9ACTN
MPHDHDLHTERLRLRAVGTADRDELRRHWSEPDVCRFLFDGVPPTARETDVLIEDSARDFAAAGAGLWIARTTDGGPLIGTAGLRPLDDLGLEVYYSVAPEAWGKGYATEAAGAVVGHALGPLGLPFVLAEVDEANTASAAIVTRLGLVPYETVPGLLGPMTRYRRDAAPVTRTA